MKNKIVLVDICGTLYNSNTTFDFLDYYLKSKNYLLFRKFSKLYVWKVLNKVSLVIFKYDLTRSIAVGYLKNKTKQELSEAVDLFYEEVLVNLKNIEPFLLLEEFKSKGYRVILVSATLDFIAKKVSLVTNVSEYYATDLVYINDKCVGQIENDLLAKKLKYLISKNILPPYELTMSDNFSDICLFENSRNKLIISKKKDFQKWNSVIQTKKITNCEIRTL